MDNSVNTLQFIVLWFIAIKVLDPSSMKLFYLVILSSLIKSVSGIADKIDGAEPIKKKQFPFFVEILLVDYEDV